MGEMTKMRGGLVMVDMVRLVSDEQFCKQLELKKTIYEYIMPALEGRQSKCKRIIVMLGFPKNMSVDVTQMHLYLMWWWVGVSR
jgi:hypothetical protein